MTSLATKYRNGGPNPEHLPDSFDPYSMHPSCVRGETTPELPISGQKEYGSPTATKQNLQLPVVPEDQVDHLGTVDHTTVRNIIIFGDSGVGKSSLINMLAGHKAAKTSSSVMGCTFQSSHYRITIDDETFHIWDTAGLDEGTHGRVPADVAEKHLAKLLQDLGNANGIHLLVYCIRGSSVRKALARNYTIFYSAICRKKVPIVAVVTGLENEPCSMEDWWITGEKDLARYKMRFHAHACVTTLDMQRVASTPLEERSKQSQHAVRKLIIDNCRRVPSQPSDTNILIKAALLDLRSIIKSGWDNITHPAANVIICSTDLQVFVWEIMGDWTRCTSRINGRPFVFHRAADPLEGYIPPKGFKVGADLLIFVGGMNEKNKERLQKFYSSWGGELCPLLIVTDERSTDAWTGCLSSLGIHAPVLPLSASSNDGQPSKSFHATIDELCLVRGAAKYRRGSIFRFFLRNPEEPTLNGRTSRNQTRQSSFFMNKTAKTSQTLSNETIPPGA
ncbi:hypothetical protein PAXRUDRAFT_823147 [Paxillus rubicundulus Ve08.2h10]|uniref:G domain-containing protein n=1 Tax=Paxillus rubicundulus Ve08.2h10 TaxID=930991 RepID=A0A0D0ECC1_9AGAM|nr:hypothetical protein PAXRUDRAFT_823147 [Paxillus rubicundulus Ve08.2h10]